MAVDIAKTIVEKYKEEDVLECVDSFLRAAENQLKPQDGPYSQPRFGVAYVKVQDARLLLAAYRNKKFPSGPSVML